MPFRVLSSTVAERRQMSCACAQCVCVRACCVRTVWCCAACVSMSCKLLESFPARSRLALVRHDTQNRASSAPH
eukprot:scaffold15464_cov140-Isochrysis_galbana.AAC.1